MDSEINLLGLWQASLLISFYNTTWCVRKQVAACTFLTYHFPLIPKDNLDWDNSLEGRENTTEMFIQGEFNPTGWVARVHVDG